MEVLVWTPSYIIICTEALTCNISLVLRVQNIWQWVVSWWVTWSSTVFIYIKHHFFSCVKILSSNTICRTFCARGMDIGNLKTKLEVAVQRSELILDVFHIAFLIRSFLLFDPSYHPVGWWSSMSSFLMFVTYKRYFFFPGSMFYAYVFNPLLLSDVLLKTVKT